jgi:hypothetical protein
MEKRISMVQYVYHEEEMCILHNMEHMGLQQTKKFSKYRKVKEKTYRGDPGGSKREKIQSPQILEKKMPCQSARHKISNDANGTSNGV